jgi:hypothetical protein
MYFPGQAFIPLGVVEILKVTEIAGDAADPADGGFFKGFDNNFLPVQR